MDRSESARNEPETVIEALPPVGPCRRTMSAVSVYATYTTYATPSSLEK